MSDSKVLFEFRGDATNIQKALNGIDEHLIATSEKAEKVGTSFTRAGKTSQMGGTTMAAGARQASNAVTNLNWIISDSPYLFENMRMGIMSVSNNITPMLRSFTDVQRETGGVKQAFSAMAKSLKGPMGVTLAVTAVVAVVQVFSILLAKHKRKARESAGANKELAESFDQIQKSTSIDSLQRQIEQSNKLSEVTEKRLNLIKEEKDNLSSNKKEIKDYLGVLQNKKSLYKDGIVVTKDDAKEKLQSLLGVYLQLNAEADLNKDSYKNILNYMDDAESSSKVLLESEKKKREFSELHLGLQKEAGFESEKSARYEERKEEFRIAQLKPAEQIVEWETKEAELKALILKMEVSKGATDAEILEKKERLLEIEQKLYALKTDKEETSDDGEAIVSEAEKRIKAIKEYTDAYNESLAEIISDGDLEGIYDKMFSNIKQKVLQYWLDRLGITKAMVNMEQIIITFGQQGIDGVREWFHQRELARQVKETAGAAVEAGTKATASASGIPFPGNIAAIGLVLASVFSALRNAKVTGKQIVGAAEGAFIDKPTLLLAGEAIGRSGAEIVMPEKNFNRYMDEKILPGIMAKVNVNSQGTEQRLDRVEKAIYSIGKQIPGETGKAVKRALRGKF